MLIGFTGDLSFRGIRKFTDNPFKHVESELSRLNLVVNLESPFVSTDKLIQPVKNKICLRQDNQTVELLKRINPLLINLSNNHINDYGNYGVENTYDVLKKNGLNYLGAGLENEAHNIFRLDQRKIVFLAYTLGTDRFPERLYNTSGYRGPKQFTFDLLKKDLTGLDEYTKVVLFHWGAKPRKYPFVEQRRIAYRLIEHGIDLIIGNHAHMIQPFEQYQGKWIFYALGNFLFPDYFTEIKGRKYASVASSKNRKSIVPVFDFFDTNDIRLVRILDFNAGRHFELKSKNDVAIKYETMLLKNLDQYENMYRIYEYYLKLFHYLSLPYRWTVFKIKRKNLYDIYCNNES